MVAETRGWDPRLGSSVALQGLVVLWSLPWYFTRLWCEVVAEISCDIIVVELGSFSR